MDEINYETAEKFKDELVRLLRTNKIYAIKFVRAATGGGLKECKDFVEVLEDAMDAVCPCCNGCGRVTARKARDVSVRISGVTL